MLKRYFVAFCLFHLMYAESSFAQFMSERPFNLPSDEPYSPVLTGAKMVITRAVYLDPDEASCPERDTVFVDLINQEGYSYATFKMECGTVDEKYAQEVRNGRMSVSSHFRRMRNRRVSDMIYPDTVNDEIRDTWTYGVTKLIRRNYTRCNQVLVLDKEDNYAFDNHHRVVSDISKKYWGCNSSPGFNTDSIIYRYTGNTLVRITYDSKKDSSVEKYSIRLNNHGRILKWNSRSPDSYHTEVYKYDRKGRLTDYHLYTDKKGKEDRQKSFEIGGGGKPWRADKIHWSYNAHGWLKDIAYYEQGIPTFEYVYQYIF